MNRHILRIVFAAALAAVSMSCSKDEAVNPARERTSASRQDGSSSPYSLMISAGRGQSADENAGTRAYVDLNDSSLPYYWDARDQVVTTVTPAGATTAVTGFDRFVMTGTNTAPATHANFRADLSMAQYTALSAQGAKFDYYSYFPANINGLGNTNFPNSLSFTIPSSFSATPNTFVSAVYAPMVAAVKNRGADIIQSADLTAEGKFAENVGGIHFDYTHVMSYAALEMDTNLLPGGVTVQSITMTSNNNVMLWGTYTCTNMATGAGSYSGGNNSITINIPGGLTVGSGQVIYVPMPVQNVTGFTFAFTTNSSTQGYETMNTTTNANFTTKGVNFQRGQIHKIRLAPAARYTYTGNTTGVQYQITESGYYFIEAWGGNGGNKEVESSGTIVATGGASNRIAGLYEFNAGEWLTMYIGSAGINASISTTGNAAGGTNGSSYGNGGAGGAYNTGTPYNSERGSGGGAATFVFRSSTTSFNFPADIVIVSGGGGGSGGAAQGSFGSNAASGGGAGASMDNIANNGGIGSTGSNGGTTNMSGKGGSGTGTAGAGGSGNGNGSTGTAGSTTSGNGGSGGRGGSAFLQSAGGGGGGGGGGWITGGGGGGGGSTRAGLGTAPGAGGGGGGGQSYIGVTAPNPGYTFPNNTRVDPGNNVPINGYVFITFLRPR